MNIEGKPELGDHLQIIDRKGERVGRVIHVENRLSLPDEYTVECAGVTEVVTGCQIFDVRGR